MKRSATKLLRLFAAALPLLVSCGSAQVRTRPLTIIHTNDLHARFLPDEQGRGGFAEVTTAIRQERAKSVASIVLSAGDLVQGTPVSSIYEGIPCYEVANAMGFDVHTIGNHEFDYGWRQVLRFLEVGQFTTVNANLVDGEGRLVLPEAYAILDINGIQVGVIGAIMERLDRLTQAEKRGPWRTLPVAGTVRRLARELGGKTDLVVLLAHLFDEEEEEVLRDVPEVDVIVGGHNHHGLEAPKVVDGRVLVKAQAYGVEIGRLDLEVDTSAGRVVSHRWTRIPVRRATHPPDRAVARLVGQWEAKVAEVVDVAIGRAERAIPREEVKALVEEAIRDKVGADVAFTNAGGIRDALPKGTILVRHVWNVMPFDNLIVYGKVKGSALPPEVRASAKLDPEREYLFATNDFLAEQWEKEGGPALGGKGPLVREAIIDLIREKKVLR